jgi:hypothetical protein
MSILLLLAAQIAPVPATPLTAVDHQFRCTVFTREGVKQELTGSARVEKRMTWRAQVSLASPGGPFPVGAFRASANGPNSLAIKTSKDSDQLTYLFERTSDATANSNNGTVQVSKLITPGRFAYLASGICDFTSKVQS